MSISGSGTDPVERWDDLEKVQIEQTARVVDAASNQGYNRQLPQIDVQRSDVLSLQNDEVAELVALQINGHRGYYDNNNYGATSNFRYAMSIAVNYDDMDWVRTNDIETDNIGTSGEVAGRTRVEDRGNLIWWNADTFIATVNDTPNGAGGVGWPSVENELINFRQHFGQGPMLDNQDNFTHGAFFRTVNTQANTNLVQLVDWTGYFQVYETDRIFR
jgi:hypothetical protein